LIATPPKLPVRGKKIRDDRHGPTSWASITITEGKFRQVRKMTAAVGFPTLRLIRIRIGSIELDDLDAGEVRELDLTSFDSLRNSP
jgi:23S rRNA pseudouridine2457 synthase